MTSCLTISLDSPLFTSQAATSDTFERCVLAGKCVRSSDITHRWPTRSVRGNIASMDTNEILRRICNLIRKGSVCDVDLATDPPSVRVSIGNPDGPESSGLTTNWLPFLTPRAGTTRVWNPPTLGEPVMLFCALGDLAQGVAWGGFFTKAAPPPSRSPNVHATVYPDHAIVQYDHVEHELSATLPDGSTIRVVAPGEVTVETKHATLKASTINLDGDVIITKSMKVRGPLEFESGLRGKGASGKDALDIEGGATFSDDVRAAGVSVANHPHMAQGPSSPTSKPIKVPV